MIRLFVFIGSLLVLVLAAALVAPPLVDWDRYGTSFEDAASRIVGQPVKVRGQTKVRLLPLPSVTFTNIAVGEHDDGLPLLEARSFHMTMELAPLLKGDIVVVDLTMQNPHFTATIGDDGTLDWLSRQVALPGDFKRSEITLEKLVIDNGALRLIDRRSGIEHLLTNVDMEASARALNGPWIAEGEAKRLGQRYRFRASSGRWQDSGRITLKAKVEPQHLPFDFSFAGPLVLTDGTPILEGTFNVVRLLEQSAADRISFKRPVDPGAFDARLEGQMQLTADKVTVPEYRLEIGGTGDPYIIDGEAEASFGEEESFEITAVGQQIDVHRLTAQTKGEGEKLDLRQRIAAVREALERVPPISGEGIIKLELPAFVAGDTIIRDIDTTARALPKGRGWELAAFEAQLPGLTALQGAGTLYLGSRFAYEGSLTVASRQPSGFARWLSDNVDASIRELTSAGIVADRAKVDADSLLLDDFTLLMDGKELKGWFSRQAADDGPHSRPRIVADLKGEQANFDQIQALLKLFSAPGSAALAQHDVDLDLKVDVMRAAGIEAAGVEAQVAMRADRLDIDNLEIADVLGAKVTASGSLGPASGADGTSPEMSITSGQLAPLLSLMQKRLGPWRILDHLLEDDALTRDAELSLSHSPVEAGGASQSSGYVMSGTMSGTQFELAISGEDVAQPVSLAGLRRSLATMPSRLSATASNSDGATMLAQLGLPVDSAAIVVANALSDPMTGDLAIEVDEARSDAEGQPVTGHIAVGASRLEFAGRATGLPALEAFGFDVSFESSNLDGLILLSGRPIPGFGNGVAAELKARVERDGERVNIEGLVGSVAGRGTRGRATLDLSAEPRPVVMGDLFLDEVDAAFVTALVHGGEGIADGESGGELRGSQASEVAELAVLSGIDGALGFTVGEVALPFDGDLATARQASGTIRLADGDVTIDGLRADFAEGRLAGRIGLARTGAARLVNGDLALNEAKGETLLAALGFSPFATGSASLSGTFQASAAPGEALLGNLTGSGSAELKDLTISVLDDGILKPVLSRFDAERRQEAFITPGELRELGLFEGAFDAGATDFDFSVASGILRATALQLSNDRIGLRGDARYSLVNESLEAGFRLSLEPGRNAIIGAAPEVTLALDGTARDVEAKINVTLLATYLGMRAAERREREFQSQKDNILEKQRLLRLARLYRLEKEAREEAERKRQEAERLEKERIERERLEREKREAERAAAAEAARTDDAQRVFDNDNVIDSLSRRVLESLVIE